MNTSLSKKLLNAPCIVWSAIFIIVPLFIVLYYTFLDENGGFTLQNIYNLADYKGVFLTSIIYALAATLICLLLSYPFAYFLSKISVNSQKMMILLVMLPMWMNLLIKTYAWTVILDNNGILNRLLNFIGFDSVKFLGTPGAVILGMVYDYIPYMILPIYTTISKIDYSLIEAAEDLGSNPLSALKRVVVPLSLPGVLSGITMVFVPSISTFYISQKLGNGMILLAGDIIETQFKIPNYHMGAAMSLVLMIFIIISMAIMNKFGDSENGGGVLV